MNNSPVLTDGGGLKPLRSPTEATSEQFPRPHRRGRIETSSRQWRCTCHSNSPVLTDGGGLKRIARRSRSVPR